MQSLAPSLHPSPIAHLPHDEVPANSTGGAPHLQVSQCGDCNFPHKLRTDGLAARPGQDTPAKWLNEKQVCKPAYHHIDLPPQSTPDSSLSWTPLWQGPCNHGGKTGHGCLRQHLRACYLRCRGASHCRRTIKGLQICKLGYCCSAVRRRGPRPCTPPLLTTQTLLTQKPLLQSFPLSHACPFLHFEHTEVPTWGRGAGS